MLQGGETMNNQTFGQYLKRVLDKRAMSTRTLASKMGLKSKTQITRLLDDRCTIRTIEAFSEKLKESIPLSKKELSDMEEVILNHGTSTALLHSRNVLKSLLTGTFPEQSERIRCFLRNGSDCNENEYHLENIITGIVDKNTGAKIEMFIRNINSVELISTLGKIIRRNPTPDITIYHFLSDGDSVQDSGVQLCGLLNLGAFTGYNPYRLPEGMKTGSGMVVFVNGSEQTTLVNVFSGKQFSEITAKFPEDMYTHIKKSYSCLESISTPLKNCFKSDTLEKLSRYVEELVQKDTVPSIELGASICFMMIPFHIQERLYEESNYIGLGKDHPIIKKLYADLKQRCEYLNNSRTSRNVTLICTRKGLNRFLETGKTDDWFPFFRPLTVSERVETIEHIKQFYANNIHFLEPQYSVDGFECVVFQGHGIQICEPMAGYWSNFSMVEINDRKMERLLKDFLVNDVIRDCCVSRRDNRKIWADIDRMIANMKH